MRYIQLRCGNKARPGEPARGWPGEPRSGLESREAWSADGSDADASAVQWQIGEWTGQGSPLSTTELPAGSWTVEASLELEGQMVTDSVEISVWAR